MTRLTILGLILDLVGVLLLGVDVLRIQWRLRREARDRLASLAEVFDGYENLERWMDELARNADWREHERDEGRYVPVSGTFDPGAARESITEITRQISELGSDIAKLAQLQMAAANADRKTAGISLAYTFTGLAMIVVGFALQIIAQY